MVIPAQSRRAPSAAITRVAPPVTAAASAEQQLTGHFAGRVAPRAWGWATPGGGRCANVEGGVVYQATSAQVCGLFPFALSSGATTPGVPIGRHMLTAEPVGLDPAEWLREGMVSNTGVWVQGQPGIGKSTIVKRMLIGLICFGAAAVVPGDVKGEYSALVDALGGRVWRIGRGQHSLNPLDAGPLRAAVARASGAARERLIETIRARQLSLLEALVVIVRRGQITVTERLVLGAALDLAVATTTAEPIIPDVAAQLSDPSPELLRIAAASTAEEFSRELRDLVNSLGLLCRGAIRGMFDRQSSVTVDLDTPAMSLDLSALDDDDDEVVAAAMLCSWAWAAAMIDGAAALGQRRTVVRVQDELWRALRVAPGLVEMSDRVTRLNRHRGEISFQVTHSLDDLEALPTEADRAKARGMASRSGIMVLGGMADKELDGIRRITPMTTQESAMVRSWAAPPTWVAGSVHPGRGKYLLKSGERMGLPVALSLVAAERDLYDTDRAFTRRPR